jgi:pimeloyl-ACP methyl ester carboxylesterase
LFRWFVISIALLSILIPSVSIPAASATEMPTGTTKPLPTAKEESVSTFVPSEAAPGKGLAVNVIYPAKARYEEGAPVAVVVPGGDTANGLGFCAHASQVGFVEVRFAFPGGGVKGFSSSGERDYRGENDQIALRDVLLFAMGKLEDYKERTIKDLVPVKLAPDNVGIVGWSNGGNTALVTLNKYPEELNSIAWIAFYESPIGPLFFPPSLGSSDDIVLNSHYRQGSGATGRCLIDFRKLAYDADVKRNPGVYKKLGITVKDVPGVVYFDDNGNKHWDEAKEFAFNYLTAGRAKDAADSLEYYPPEVVSALERLDVFKGAWPPTIANAEAVDKFFQERDGSLYIPSVCSKYPKLLVTVVGTHLDHMQRQPDHPHILLQYNLWLDNGAHWVRVNPEPAYLQAIASMNMRTFAHNQPNNPLEPDDISVLLEPEGILKDYTFVDAAIAELADRTKTKSMATPLDAPLVAYSNGAPMPAALDIKEKDKFGNLSTAKKKIEPATATKQP